MSKEKTVENKYQICGLEVGMTLGKIRCVMTNEKKECFKLATGKIKSFSISARKQTVTIEGWYPQDIEDVVSDIDFFSDMVIKNEKADVMMKDTFFIADDPTVKRVNDWIEWANNCNNEEYKMFK